MWTRAELKERAKGVVHGNYWMSVGILVLFSVIESAVASIGFIPFLGAICATAATVFVVLPFELSKKRFLLNNRSGNGSMNDIGYAFNKNYMNQIGVMFMMELFIFLWSLLFLIPGIVKSYSYRMVPYILAENPEIGYKEALERSRNMMDGQKWAAFVLDLSFIGWWLLSGITFGILAIFWVSPYVEQTNTELYAALSGNNNAFIADDNTATADDNATTADDNATTNDDNATV